MQKILFYMNSIHYGGAERVIVNLANEFSNRSYEVIFVTSFKVNDEYLLNDKVKRLILEKNNFQQSFMRRNITRTIKLRDICKRENPNIVISFMAEPNFRSIIATMFLKIKTLISVRNDPNKEYPNVLFKFMAKILYLFVSGCVFQTEDAKKWFPKKVQRKSQIILNHVEQKFYEINYNGKRKNIITVGRLEPQKNHKLLIESFAKIANDFPNENLVIYGDGSQRQILKELTKTLGIENRVIFMGTSKNIQEKIKDAKLFVLTSKYEGLPNAIMEAMTLGIPVISTDCPCGGPRILIHNNKDGILVKIDNIEEVSNVMRKVLSNPDFANYLSYNAKIRAKEFEPNKVFKIWENYVDRIVSNK